MSIGERETKQNKATTKRHGYGYEDTMNNGHGYDDEDNINKVVLTGLHGLLSCIHPPIERETHEIVLWSTDQCNLTLCPI